MGSNVTIRTKPTPRPYGLGVGLSMGYKKDIFAGFGDEFELS